MKCVPASLGQMVMILLAGVDRDGLRMFTQLQEASEKRATCSVYLCFGEKT